MAALRAAFNAEVAEIHAISRLPTFAEQRLQPWLTGPDTLGLWRSLAVQVVLSVVGVVLICLGLLLMIATIRLFATVGQGTLAPWNPTQRLVVQGVHRHVRNPMISGVLAILLGERRQERGHGAGGSLPPREGNSAPGVDRRLITTRPAEPQ